jgi:RNA polymerase sigma-70 factor, ECF subfamily
MIEPGLLDRAYRAARADRWALPPAALAAALEAGIRRAFGTDVPGRRELERYIDSLHLEDLALACACELGHEAAWEHFVKEHRPVLYRAASAIDRTGGARDLADSLYAELFGVRSDGPDRRSLFRYFHGRSSLATWLRAILAQRHVDRIRTERRLEPLPEEESVASRTAPPDPDRTRLAALVLAAFGIAIADVPVRDRLRMRAYYGQGLTLAEVGKLTGEHEATVSRQLARVRRLLRDRIDREIRQTAGISQAEVADCWRAALEDAGAFDLKDALGPDAGMPVTGDPGTGRGAPSK